MISKFFLQGKKNSNSFQKKSQIFVFGNFLKFFKEPFLLSTSRNTTMNIFQKVADV